MVLPRDRPFLTLTVDRPLKLTEENPLELALVKALKYFYKIGPFKIDM